MNGRDALRPPHRRRSSRRWPSSSAQSPSRSSTSTRPSRASPPVRRGVAGGRAAVRETSWQICGQRRQLSMTENHHAHRQRRQARLRVGHRGGAGGRGGRADREGPRGVLRPAHLRDAGGGAARLPPHRCGPSPRGEAAAAARPRERLSSVPRAHMCPAPAGSRLDFDSAGSSCRLVSARCAFSHHRRTLRTLALASCRGPHIPIPQAFHGRVCAVVDSENPADLARLRVFKWKQREGTVERRAPRPHLPAIWARERDRLLHAHRLCWPAAAAKSPGAMCITAFPCRLLPFPVTAGGRTSARRCAGGCSRRRPTCPSSRTWRW